MSRWLRDRAIKTLGGLLRPIYGGLGCILSFHRVVASDDRSPLWANRALEITPGGLRAVLGWVRKRGFEVIRPDEIRSRLTKPRGTKFFCFTFDDGYRDNLTEALPIFGDFGYPFTINVATRFIDRTASLWWYMLEDILAARSDLTLEWAGKRYEWAWGNPGEREQSFAELAGLIRSQDASSRDHLIAAIGEAGGVDPLARTRDLMLTWEQVQVLAMNWHVTIGAHTRSHHVLTQLSPEDLYRELLDAKTELEGRIGKRVQHMAYPFGGRDAAAQREFDAALQADFETAWTTRCGNLFQQHAWHLHALPRIGMDGNYPPLHLLEKLENGLVTAASNQWRRVVTA